MQGVPAVSSMMAGERLRGIQQHNGSDTAATSWTLMARQTVPYWFSSNQLSLNSGDPSNANYAIVKALRPVPPTLKGDDDDGDDDDEGG